MPALETILHRGSELGIREFVIGMPHRGRLNVLANFVGKPFAAVFSEFQGNSTNPEHVHGSGDVKYHLGTSGDREVGWANNPSVLGRQPLASRGRRSRRARQGPGKAIAARRHRAIAGGRHSDAWRCGFRRTRARRRIARTVGSDRLLHRRHDPHHRQQPDRVYDGSFRRPLEPLSIGCGEGRPGADLSRQRRRSRGGRRSRPRRHRIPPAIQKGCRHRPVLLSPPRPQRDRRAGLHPAADVPHHRAPPDDAADLCRAPRRGGRASRRRGRCDGDSLHRRARSAVRGGEELPPEQGGLARRRLGRARTGSRR